MDQLGQVCSDIFLVPSGLFIKEVYLIIKIVDSESRGKKKEMLYNVN